MSSIVKAYY